MQRCLHTIFTLSKQSTSILFHSWGDTNKYWYTLGFCVCTKESLLAFSKFVSVKNQVAGCVDVVEDGGAEVERRREGEEGLEGP